MICPNCGTECAENLTQCTNCGATLPATCTCEAAPAAPAKNGMAIASLICGIVSLVCCGGGGIVSVLAIVFGIIGLTKAKETGVGKGMAIAGIIIAAVGVVLSIVIAIVSLSTGVLAGLFGASTATTPSYYYYY